MRVSSGGDPNKIAGAIAGRFRNNEDCILSAIAADAVNNAVKAVAISSFHLERTMWFRVNLASVEISGRIKPAAQLRAFAVDPERLFFVSAENVQECRVTNTPETRPITDLILACYQENHLAIDLACVGAGVVYRAVKAIARASKRLKIRVIPRFEDFEDGVATKTRMILRICYIR